MKSTTQEYMANLPKIHFQPGLFLAPKEILKDLTLEQYPVGTREVRPMQDNLDVVNQHYTLPFQPYDYQKAAIDALAHESTAGLWLEVGAGKTVVGTYMALYHRTQNAGTIIVVMPPILITQWAKFFSTIPEIKTITTYRGTPKQREKLPLDVDVLLVSMDIFKNDFRRLYDFYYDKNVTLIVDEAISVKNPTTTNHLCVWAFQNQDLTQYEKAQQRKERRKVVRKQKAEKQAETQSRQQAKEEAKAEAKSLKQRILERLGLK